jgi:hypothetical protein
VAPGDASGGASRWWRKPVVVACCASCLSCLLQCIMTALDCTCHSPSMECRRGGSGGEAMQLLHTCRVPPFSRAAALALISTSSACLSYASIVLPHHQLPPGRGTCGAERSVSGGSGEALARGSAASQAGFALIHAPTTRQPPAGAASQKGLRMAAAAGLGEASELSFSPSHSAGDQVRCRRRPAQRGYERCPGRPPLAPAPLVDKLSPLPTPAHRCPPRSRPATAAAPPPAAPPASFASRLWSGRRQAPRLPAMQQPRRAPRHLLRTVPSAALPHKCMPVKQHPCPYLQATSVKQSAKQVNARLMQALAPQMGAASLAAHRGPAAVAMASTGAPSWLKPYFIPNTATAAIPTHVQSNTPLPHTTPHTMHLQCNAPHHTAPTPAGGARHSAGQPRGTGQHQRHRSPAAHCQGGC